jgi:hypothetical protein
MFNTSQNSNISSHERRRLINMYVNQYNQTNIHIERLYDTLDDIRNNINTLIGQSLRDNTNNNMNNNNMNQRSNRFNQSHSFSSNNRNSNSNNTNNRNSNNSNSSRPYIYYDYDHPINPSTYIDPLMETSNNTQDITNFLTTFLNSNVPIRATEEQINISSRIVRYSDITNPNSTCCAITLEPFMASDDVRQIHFCGHMFFPQEFTQWFQHNVRCPVCRYDIRNYVPSQSQAHLESSTDQNGEIPPLDTNDEIPPLDTNLFTNFNTLRNSTTNNIDQVSFDISDNEITNTILSSITSRLLTSLFTPQNTNTNTNTNANQTSNNDRFVYDPSNNLFLYETTIRRNSS